MSLESLKNLENQDIKDIKLYPSWYGKINHGNGSKNHNIITETNNICIEDYNEKYISPNYDENNDFIKSRWTYYNTTSQADHNDLAYNISRIHRHILGYLDYHKYYLKPIKIINKRKIIRPNNLDKNQTTNSQILSSKYKKFSNSQLINNDHNKLYIDEYEICSDIEYTDSENNNYDLYDDFDDPDEFNHITEETIIDLDIDDIPTSKPISNDINI